MFQTKKINKSNLAILAASIIATLINPYGERLWLEIWHTFTNSYLHQFIDEWTPGYAQISFDKLVILLLSAGLTLKYWRKIPLFTILLYLILLIGAISSKKQIPLWLLAALPLTGSLLKKLYTEKFLSVKPNLALGSYLLLIFIFVLAFALHGRTTFRTSYIMNGTFFYPQQAIKFIENKNIPGNIFSSYNWGGYLIWQYPQKKVFVDGRMPTWFETTPVQNDSQSAFADYVSLLQGKMDFLSIADKYHINLVIWPNTDHQQKTIIYSKTRPHSAAAAGSKSSSSGNLFIQKLKQAGWQKIYADPVAVIYERPNISK